MKVKIIIIVFFSLSIFASAIGEEWEGTVAMAQYGEFPANGFYGASNAFPRNTIIEVRNSKNGKTVTLIIISRLDQQGLFLLVSREAAQGLGFNADEIIRADIKIVSVSGDSLASNGHELPVSPDADINPAASAEDVEESVYQKAIKNLRDRYALSTSKYQPDTTQQDTTQQDTTQQDTTQQDLVQNDTTQQDTTRQQTQEDNTPEVLANGSGNVKNGNENPGVNEEPDLPDHVEIEDNAPQVLADGSRIPDKSHDSLGASNAEEPALPDDYPEINTGFVKAGDYDADSLVAVNPAEPKYQEEQTGPVQVVKAVPEDFGPEPRYSDLQAKPAANRDEFDNVDVSAPETSEDDIAYSDAFAEPGTYNYNFEADVLDMPVDPSLAGKEFAVDDTSAKPLIHDNRNFDNLAVIEPLESREDKAVYDSLYAKTPKQAGYSGDGFTPPDPYAFGGADTMAANPEVSELGLTAQHDPEVEGIETPHTIDSLAAVPGIRATPLLAVEMEPETPDQVVQDIQTVPDTIDKTPDRMPNSTVTTVTLVPTDRIQGNNVSGPLPEDNTRQQAGAGSEVVEKGKLKAGNEYLQLAVFTDETSVMKVYDQYAEAFPISVLVSSTKNGKNYKVLIGPLGPDEGGAVLYNFKRHGYKDAFLRKE